MYHHLFSEATTDTTSRIIKRSLFCVLPAGFQTFSVLVWDFDLPSRFPNIEISWQSVQTQIAVKNAFLDSGCLSLVTCHLLLVPQTQKT